MDNIWQLQHAKSKFSELVDRALSQGVQIVTRRGDKAVVILPFSEYERLTRPESKLSQFLLSSPLAGSDISIERDRSFPPDPGIEA